jgi:outer membrane protein assembly factor BamB
MDAAIDTHTHDVSPPYVPQRDTPAPRPGCGADLTPSQTRAVAPGVVGRVAIDEAGNVYAPSATSAGELALLALDPCGQPIWQRVVASKVPETPVAARLPGVDEVMLESLDASGTSQGLWRFDRSGKPLAPLTPRGSLFGWVASTQAGLLVRTYEDQSYLTLLSRDGTERRRAQMTVARGQTIPTGEEECAAFGTRLGCYSEAFDTPTLDVVWSTNELDLIDGTTRHVVNPASDGERLYSLAYGVSNYRFVATSLQTGARLWSRELGPSPSGQSGLVTGGPVIGENGLVYVYIAYSKLPVTRITGDIDEVVEPGKDFGWLIAFDDQGNERWRHEAPHPSFAEYREHATHLAGDDGLIYLAISSGVFALDANTGEVRWQRTDLGRIRTPRLSMSPNGDLLVQVVGEGLYYLATGAHGLAVSPWPAPGGDRRNLNSR